MTVTVPTPCEVCLARACLGTEEQPYIKMTVPVLNSEESYIIAAPKAMPYTPPGCTMCGFVAFNIRRSRRVYLKDTWRVDLPGIEQEGKTYWLMEEAQVRNISPCSAAGDIKGHRTVTHLYNNKSWACKGRKLVPHHHYRLVLDIIGDSLKDFSSSRTMLRCVVDALQGKCFLFDAPVHYSFLVPSAHEDAYNKAGILHCDISVGNILITNGHGILIDWDLSKRMKDPSARDKVTAGDKVFASDKVTTTDKVTTSNKVRQPTQTVSSQLLITLV
jgi:hypothetical protein